MIEVQGLMKEFDGKRVLNEINFDVERGEVFGYLGPNGAGKTTTMRIILGLLEPTSGRALVFGKRLGDDSELRNRVGILLENDGLYPKLSAYENMDFYIQLYGISDGVERKKRIEELLEFTGLSESRNDKVGNFSKGMKRKLALVRSVIHQPEVLFLDEPSAGLDPEAQIMVRDLIVQLSKEKEVTIFLNSHDLDEVQRICSKVAILVGGEIMVLDTVENLREKFSQPVVEIYFNDESESEIALEFLMSLDYALNCERDGKMISLTLSDKTSSDLLNDLMKKGLKVEEIRKARKSLEDVYLEVVRGR